MKTKLALGIIIALEFALTACMPSLPLSLFATATPTRTATLIPPTATQVPPTATARPPTATQVPPTLTPIPPTATLAPTTARIPPPPTRVPTTATPRPSPTPASPCGQLQPGFAGLLFINNFDGAATVTIVDHEYSVPGKSRRVIPIPADKKFTIDVFIPGVGRLRPALGPYTWSAGECHPLEPHN